MRTAELFHPVPLDRIGAAGLDVVVEASAAECAALAERMQVPAVHALTCRYHLTREQHDQIAASGHLRARITQTCVLSLEDFEAEIDEVFRVRFVPAGEEADEIDPESDDDLPYEGNSIDLGAATAEQLGLAIDPYPRMPGAELPAEDTSADKPANPFAGLAGLRKLN